MERKPELLIGTVSVVGEIFLPKEFSYPDSGDSPSETNGRSKKMHELVHKKDDFRREFGVGFSVVAARRRERMPGSQGGGEKLFFESMALWWRRISRWWL